MISTCGTLITSRVLNLIRYTCIAELAKTNIVSGVDIPIFLKKHKICRIEYSVANISTTHIVSFIRCGYTHIKVTNRRLVYV